MRTPVRASIAATISLAVLFAAAAAYAGGSAGSTSRGSTGGSPPVTGSGSNVREGPAAPQPQVVEPTPGMTDVHPRGFDTATVGDDDRTVTIDFVSGIEPCYVLDHIDVAYGNSAVTITLYEGHQPTNEDVACIDIGVFKRAIVTLDEPLAGRTIVDGGASA